MKNLKKYIKNAIRFVNINVPIRRKLFLNEIRKRTDLPLTLVKELSKDISILAAYSTELHQANDYYSHASTLKKYLGLPDSYQFKFAIEHGVLTSSQISNMEANLDLPSIVTSSIFRKNILEKISSNVYSIGPYIYYAKHYLSKRDLANEKRRLGKNLLVIPTHSTSDLLVDYDINEFCKKINLLARKFDSVRVCLYWKDVLRKMDIYYRSYGFECVTAGHVYDPNFLPRLKSIIETSSYTLSNESGSHVGYCIAMNKPHIVLKQTIRFSGDKEEVRTTLKNIRINENKDLLTAFSKFEKRITNKQRSVIDKYWGLSEIKTKKELLNIVNQTEKIYRHKYE